MKKNTIKYATAGILIILSFSFFISCTNTKNTKDKIVIEYFNNPILDDGPDPYVYLHEDGFYYCMVTKGDRLKLWKTSSFTDLDESQAKEIWFPPETGGNSCCIWAPEIHFIDNTWYIYYSATDKDNPVDLSRHVFVLRNNSDNPFEDSWEDLGKVETKSPGIDGHIFDYKGKRYFAYSPYIGAQSGIVLAEMITPTTIGEEIVLGLPIYDWEKTPPREILEGPQFLEGPKDKIFIIYYAGACWDDNYGLGFFMADKDADLLNPDSWLRSEIQIFEQCRDSSVFGPGHNCFTKSPNGAEDWIVYHAKKESSNKCAERSTRAQKFNWTRNGLPQFGKPISISTNIPKPLGIKN
ncbi:MAG: family 43 glycosylhydrolase [Draconibacterium sp.]|nr:family 43 glycosylhydrolase [Draconibacterium sp.]